MSFDLRTKVALIIHFNDSIGEGYGYYNHDYVHFSKPLEKTEPIFEKIERDGYHLGIGDEYYRVADEIIALIKQCTMKYGVLYHATGMEKPAIYIHEKCSESKHCEFCSPISEDLLLQYPPESP